MASIAIRITHVNERASLGRYYIEGLFAVIIVYLLLQKSYHPKKRSTLDLTDREARVLAVEHGTCSDTAAPFSCAGGRADSRMEAASARARPRRAR
jgi:hypothetical protein